MANFQNVGREYAPKKHAVKVLDHDFPLPELGKAAPYGVYDISANEGYVSVGISADTAQFAVASIRSWWYTMGKERYPHAPQTTGLLLMAAVAMAAEIDCGKQSCRPLANEDWPSKISVWPFSAWNIEME